MRVAKTKDLKIAIVHDWLVNSGGAEREALEVCRAFPGAPIYTSVWNKEGSLPGYKDIDVRTSFIERIPVLRSKHQLAFLLRAWHWRRLDLSEYDVIISSSGSEAKGLRTKGDQVHINICYSPTHYYWSHFDEYLESPGLGLLDPLARVGLRLLIKPLRAMDLWAARKPDHMIAISNAIKARIKKYYGRNSDVIFPPVDTTPAKTSRGGRQGYVITGRHVPYKRFDLAVAACTKLDRKLVVIGDGPETDNLKQQAGPGVEFVGYVSEQKKKQLLADAECFIFPNEDDFGIVPVEALAAGTPVIAYAAGGALDTVVPGVTGEHFEDQTVDGLVLAIKRFEKKKYTPADCKAQAAKFSAAKFRKEMQAYVAKKVA